MACMCSTSRGGVVAWVRMQETTRMVIGSQVTFSAARSSATAFSMNSDIGME